jgi:hypothetical protein
MSRESLFEALKIIEGEVGRTKSDVLDEYLDELGAMVDGSIPLGRIVQAFNALGVSISKATLARYLRDQFPDTYFKNYTSRLPGYCQWSIEDRKRAVEVKAEVGREITTNKQFQKSAGYTQPKDQSPETARSKNDVVGMLEKFVQHNSGSERE